MFLMQKKLLKASQKPCHERTGTRLSLDCEPVSQKSHIKLDRVTLLRSQ